MDADLRRRDGNFFTRRRGGAENGNSAAMRVCVEWRKVSERGNAVEEWFSWVESVAQAKCYR